MIRSLWISKTGLDAQQTQLDVISNNLANVGTNGFKRSRAVFEDLLYQTMRQAGAASSDQTQLPTGLQVGLGTRAGRDRAHLHPGQPAADREPARRRDPRQRLLPGAAARRHDRLHARRLVPGRARPASSSPTPATRSSPASRSRSTAQSVTIGSDGTVTVDAARAGDAAAGRPAAARQLHQRRRPRAAGREPLRRDRRLGHADVDVPGHERPRHGAAGLRRDLERQRRRGARPDDPDAARLRDQLEGDPDVGPDAAEAGAAVSRTSRAHEAIRARSLACRRRSARPCSPRSSGCEQLNPRPPVDLAVADLRGAGGDAGAGRGERRDLPGGAVPAAVRGPPRAPRRRHAHDPDRREDLGDAEEHELDRQERQALGGHHGAADRLARIRSFNRASRRRHARATPSTAAARPPTTTSSRGTITAVVTDVLPNGNLLVAGEKQIGINQSVDVLRFSGVVDPTIDPERQRRPVGADRRRAHRVARQRRPGRGAGDRLARRFFLNVLPF